MIAKWLRMLGFGWEVDSGEPREADSEPQFDYRFGYENRILSLHGGGAFRPLKDAAYRWHVAIRETYEGIGGTTLALYERRDGKFIQVEWSCVHWSGDDETGRYVSDARPRAYFVDERRAFAFFFDHQGSGPSPRMSELLARWEADPVLFFHPENARPARPVANWRGKDYATIVSRRPADRRDGRGEIGGLLRSAQLGIELVRDSRGVETPRGMELPFVRFFVRYPVDPLDAPIDGEEQAFDPLTPEELDPRFAETEIPEIVRAIRELADGPTNLLAAETLPESHKDRPNRPERELAFGDLYANLPSFVRLASQLKAAVDRWDQDRRKEESERTKEEEATSCAACEADATGEPATLEAGLGPHTFADSSEDAETPNAFRKDGTGWLARFSGAKAFHLEAYDGCFYINHLLSRPGELVRALDLAALIAEQSAVPDSDAGEKLDVEALRSYRSRRDALVEERDQARDEGRFHDQELADQEILELDQEIAGGTGLGGRIEVALSASDRAGRRIAKAVRLVLEKIEVCDVQMHKHLKSSLKLGKTLQYVPSDGTSWKT